MSLNFEGYSSSSLGRVNSLDVLCSLDIIKFPSPASMDGLNMYGHPSEDPFLWSNTPGVGSNSSGGSYGGMNYRSSSQTQSNNSFSRSSLWPSMYNLVSQCVLVCPFLIFSFVLDILVSLTISINCLCTDFIFIFFIHFYFILFAPFLPPHLIIISHLSLSLSLSLSLILFNSLSLY